MGRLRRLIILGLAPAIILIAFATSGLYIRDGLSTAREANDRALTAEQARGLLYHLAALENAAEAGEPVDGDRLDQVVDALINQVRKLGPSDGEGEPDVLVDDATRYAEAARETTLAFIRGDQAEADELDDDETEPLFDGLAVELVATTAEAERVVIEATREAQRGLLIGSSAVVGAVLLVVVGESRRQRRQAAAEVSRRADERFRALIDTSPDRLMVVADDGRILYRSPNTVGADGRPIDHIHELTALLDEADVAALRELRDADDDDHRVVVSWTVDGSPAWFEVRVVDHRENPSIAGRVVTARDVTTSVQLQRLLERQATEDELTGLSNRRGLQRLLDDALARSRRHGTPAGLVLVDLDGFKGVNDTLGHPVGDELLRTVARRLVASTRDGEQVARLGGDEFAVVVENLDPTSGPPAICQRLLDALRVPYELGGEMLAVQASIGLAVAPSGCDSATVFSQADIALYEAKSLGGNRFVVFESAMQEVLNVTMRLEREMRPAFERGEFHLVYQPILAVDGEELVGFEALMRWSSSLLGPISPVTFIPAAERTGLIIELGRWALGEACSQLVRWRRQRPGSRLWVSVNVSVIQLNEPDFLDLVMAALDASGLEPSALQIEITESVMVRDHESLAVTLDAIRARGVMVALDDFGTGYASMSQLQSLPVDSLKIDRAFIEALNGGDERAANVVQALIQLGDALGLHVVAEGVEEADQLDELRAQNCQLAQGYLLGRPMQPEQIDTYMAEPVAGVQPTPSERPATA